MSLLATHELSSPGDFAERLVPDGTRVLLAAVHADRALPLLHELQPRALLAAAAGWGPLVLLALDGGLRLLLPRLPQRAGPQLPGLRRTGSAWRGLDWFFCRVLSLYLVAMVIRVTPQSLHSALSTKLGHLLS